MKMLLLGVNETVDIVDIDEDWQSICQAIDTSVGEYAPIIQTDFLTADPQLKDFKLIADGDALLKKDKTCNALASYLYGVTTHGNPVKGPAMLVRVSNKKYSGQIVAYDHMFDKKLQKLLINMLDILDRAGYVEDVHRLFDDYVL